MRRTPALVLATTLLLGLTAPAAQAAESPHDTDGAVLNVLPPGARGNVTALDALRVGQSRTATATTPEHFADQLEMYDALSRTAPGQLGEGDLTDYFKDAPIDLPASEAVSVEEPRAGVTISRDRFGVPFVVGVTEEDVAFGAGYAGTQDRMFLTDLLRHVGAARTAEFLGASEANVAMDRDQLRAAAYTREEAEAQIQGVLARYPVEGPGLLTRLDAFVAGINAAQRALCPAAFGLPVGEVTGGEQQAGAGFGPDCPVEYAALGHGPTDFTRGDITYIASLVGGIFGKGGGGEATNARWLNQLTVRFGAVEARKVFEDLRMRNDPESPTSATVRFPYEGELVDPTAPGAAVPDLDGDTAPGTGADAGSTNLPFALPPVPAVPGDRADFGVLDGPFGRLDLGLRKTGMSNALLVGATHSATGRPLAVFGPQTGYFAPQLLTEVSLRGPGIAARGVSFAGTQLIVELGHGVDYAWSATSASSDIVDTVAERLCSADGSAPTVTSTSYLVDGTCTPFDAYVHTETMLPSAAGTGSPAVVRLQVQRTRHGIVQTRTTVGGVPVALVMERSTYGSELTSAVGFARINDPGYTRDAASFQRAFEGVDYVFNWFYADDRDISYFGSGRLPARAPGANPDLPRWGDRAFDWQGFLPFERKARQTNPPQGYLTSWNNKQAPGFSGADNQWGYGPVYRSLLLDERIEERIARGRTVTRVGLVDAMAEAAVTDLRGEQLLPLLLDVVGADPEQSEALALLRAWVADGAQRVDRDRDGGYAHAAAIALFDQWWEGQDTAGAGTGTDVARDVLRGALGELVDVLPEKIDDHPRLGLGSAWNGVAWYGYVSKDLRRLLGRPVVAPFSRGYCGGGVLATCRTQLRASLASAVDRATAEQGVATAADLTYDKTEDSIRSTTAGLVGVRPVDWQNRPTFQQVVSFRTHRPRGTTLPPVRGPVVAPEVPPLPATGLPVLLPALGVVALAGAALARRRRVSG